VKIVTEDGLVIAVNLSEKMFPGLTIPAPGLFPDASLDVFAAPVYL